MTRYLPTYSFERYCLDFSLLNSGTTEQHQRIKHAFFQPYLPGIRKWVRDSDITLLDRVEVTTSADSEQHLLGTFRSPGHKQHLVFRRVHRDSSRRYFQRIPNPRKRVPWKCYGFHDR